MGAVPDDCSGLLCIILLGNLLASLTQLKQTALIVA